MSSWGMTSCVKVLVSGVLSGLKFSCQYQATHSHVISLHHRLLDCMKAVHSFDYEIIYSNSTIISRAYCESALIKRRTSTFVVLFKTT